MQRRIVPIELPVRPPTKFELRRLAVAKRRLRWRTAMEASALLGLFFAGLFAAALTVDGSRAAIVSALSPAERPLIDRSGDFRLASIVLMPEGGKICEERFFDNATGQIVAQGDVKCAERLPGEHANAGPVATAETARARALMTAFKR